MSTTYKCKLCGHEWETRSSKRPSRCPGCDELSWDIGHLPPLGDVLQEVTIDIQVQELRWLIATLEARVAELLAKKGKPGDTQS